MSLSYNFSDESPIVRETEVSRAMRRRSANVNLQKSIQILGEATGTPGPAQQPSATESLLDISSLFGRTIRGASVMHPPTNQGLNFTTHIEEDLTTTNVALLLEEDPGLASCSGLFSLFCNNLKANGALHQVFSLVDNYESACSDHVSQLYKLVKSAVPGQNKFVNTMEMLRHLMKESHTWALVAALYKDRLDQNMQQDEDMMIDIEDGVRSEKEAVRHFYENDALVRQCQLIIDWLEKNGRDQLDIYNQVEFFSDNLGAWENTRHQLKQQRMGHYSGSDRKIITELDPDAPLRQEKPLADLDQEDESRLLEHVFAFIRSGQLEEAQALFVKVGQAWRAAALEGWQLYHDPNHNSLGPSGRVEKVEGNPNRDLWKHVCWTLAQEEKYSAYERAIYSVFSGNLKPLLAVCTTWDDYLWAYFRVLADQLVERQIRITAKRPLIDLHPDYSEKLLTVENVFFDIQASSTEDVQKESKAQFSIIQKYIILGDVDRLIVEMYEWCRDELNPPSPQLLRFMTHLVLFFQSINLATKEELCVSIQESYVKYLIEEKHGALVATYISTLPRDIQVQWYARFLEGVEDSEERKDCLVQAEAAGLDVPSITKQVVENIRKLESSDFTSDNDMAPENATSREDRQKIDAIEWLVFDPAQRAEALRQANALMRTFLATRKLSAAREVFMKIPPGSLDVIINTWEKKTGGTELQADDDNSIREYLGHQAYLDAHDSFNEWFKHFHNAKPTRPTVPAGANFTERVAFEYKEKQYEMDFSRWKHNLMMQTKITQDKLYNVLLFVEGGWMVDKRMDGHNLQKEENRTHQMRLLRQLCLPQLCCLLHTVLHCTEQYQECVQLADLVASEHHQLYKTFRRDELQQLLHKIRESSVALLDSGHDPLGYSLTEGVLADL